MIDMNEIAKDLIVLDAISNEINQFDKIVKVTKIEPGEINNILKKPTFFRLFLMLYQSVFSNSSVLHDALFHDGQL